MAARSAFAADCIGEPAKQVVAALRPGQVALLENLRFHPGEEANSPDFARALAELGEVYVDDAFSAAHRAHASIAALAHLLPAAAGKLMEAELDALSAALEHPVRPVLALIGGAKVSTKLDLLRFLLSKVDVLAIGGAMANTLLYAQGTAVGRSLCERDMAENARQIIALAAERNCRVILPEDAVVAGELVSGAASQTVAIDAVADDMMILDIGPATVARVATALDESSNPRLERAARCFRDPAFRPRHAGGGEEGRRTHPNGTAAQRGRRRRHGGCSRRRGGDRSAVLCLDRRRRLPRMAGGAGIAGRCSIGRRCSPRLTLLRPPGTFR